MANWRTKYAQDTQNKIDNLLEKIATAKAELQAPFPLQEEFDRLSLRSYELTHLHSDDWSATLDEKAISFLFDKGFSKDTIIETILKASPTVLAKEDVFNMVEERN